MLNWIIMILLIGMGTQDFSVSQELAGTWKMKVTGGSISQPQNFDNITLEIEQEDSVITGNYMNPDLSQKGEIGGIVNGTNITFSRRFHVPSEENTYTEKYTGSIETVEKMSGKVRLYNMNGEPLGIPMKWEAEKVKE